MSEEELLFPRPTDVETPTGFFIDYIGEITDGVWPIGIVFLSFTLIYLNTDQFGSKKAFAAASFTSFITTTILVSLGALSSQALIIGILLLVLAIVINGGGDTP